MKRAPKAQKTRHSDEDAGKIAVQNKLLRAVEDVLRSPSGDALVDVAKAVREFTPAPPLAKELADALARRDLRAAVQMLPSIPRNDVWRSF